MRERDNLLNGQGNGITPEESSRKAQALFNQMLAIAEESGNPVHYSAETPPPAPYEKYRNTPKSELPTFVLEGAWRPPKEGEEFNLNHSVSIEGQLLIPTRLYGPGKRENVENK